MSMVDSEFETLFHGDSDDDELYKSDDETFDCPAAPNTATTPAPECRRHTSTKATRLSIEGKIKLRAESCKRLELADRAQQTYFLAYQLECELLDLGLWTEVGQVYMQRELIRCQQALIIPQSWRLAIRHHLIPLLPKLKRHLEKLIAVESTLLPPFEPTSLQAYEIQLQVTEDMALFLHDTIQECKARALRGEQLVAAAMIQHHARKYLHRRGYYTTKVKLTRLQRGLIPGLFDGLKGETVMNIAHDSITLEYPKALNQNTPRRTLDK